MDGYEPVDCSNRTYIENGRRFRAGPIALVATLQFWPGLCMIRIIRGFRSIIHDPRE